MSSLVNYIQPTKFTSFEFSARKFARGGGKLEARLESGGPQEVCLTPGTLMGGGKRKGSSSSLDRGLVYKYASEESGQGLSGSGSISQHSPRGLAPSRMLWSMSVAGRPFMTGHLSGAGLGLLRPLSPESPSPGHKNSGAGGMEGRAASQCTLLLAAFPLCAHRHLSSRTHSGAFLSSSVRVPNMITSFCIHLGKVHTSVTLFPHP